MEFTHLQCQAIYIIQSLLVGSPFAFSYWFYPRQVSDAMSSDRLGPDVVVQKFIG